MTQNSNSLPEADTATTTAMNADIHTWLNLAIARIDNALADADDAFDGLTASFTGIAEKLHTAQTEGDLSEDMQAAVVALQFYDRLQQRLHQVSQSLGDLNTLLANPKQQQNPEAWKELAETIRNRYMLDADVAILDAVMAGCSPTEIKDARTPDNGDAAVELF